MTGRWNKALRLIAFLSVALLNLRPPTVARGQTDLPPLIHVASLEQFALFYPDGWDYQRDEEGFTLTSSEEAAGITLAVSYTELPAFVFDSLPDVMIETELVPAEAYFDLADYGGLSGWVAQGDSLFAAEVFTAVLAFPLGETEVLIIRSDSPTATIGEDAPLLTAILHSLTYLPQTVESESWRLNLPSEWVFEVEGENLHFALDEASLSQPQTLDGLSITLERVNEETNPDSLFLAAIQEQRFTFQANGQVLEGQFGVSTPDTPAWLILVGQEDALLVRAFSNNAEILADNLALLQAVVASIQPP